MQYVILLTGPEQTNASLHFHNDEQRSPVHLGKAFGHFSCSHPGLRIAKLIEDMQLTGTHLIAKQTPHTLLRHLQPVYLLGWLSLCINFVHRAW